MAQAARLSLRMHKELKLLLSDPPHGVSFPHLSSGDLSTIDAQIQGPEETVYANGIFNVKIQIPERYPFQPPIVAFATPIYHPNIDNSGRICLDILNLPPKGAWQPSLNISTVLMSIRLLLSEPNPDDGLMCQVSREYKYNRQSFDFKAREMTDKYAKVKADGSSTSLQIQRTPSGCEVKSLGDGSGNSVLAGNHEKLKLTVESSSAHSENRDTAVKDSPNYQLLLSNTGDGNGKRKAVTGFCEANTSANEGVITSRKKLSLGLPPQSEKKDLRGQELTNEVSAACKEIKKQSNGKKLSLGRKQPLDNATSFTNNLPSSFQTSAARSDNDRLSRKLPLKPLEDSQLNEVSKTKVLVQTDMEPETNKKDARRWCREFENPGLEEASMPGSIVVQDSDESGEDEKENLICRSSRSRLSLTRRGLKRRP